MRLEVSYPNGVTHEVRPPGPAVVLGRDPACDIVLNDSKCSRRHAILERVDGRLTVRDAGSANGIYVNGRRVDQAVLAPGDSLGLGDVTLRVLDDIGETIVVAAPEELPHPRPRNGPPPARAAAASARPAATAPVRAPSGPDRRGVPQERRAPLPPAAPAAPGRITLSQEPPERPLTVTLLAGLWALFVPASVATILYAALRVGVGPAGWAVATGTGALLAGLGVAMALGLRGLAPWAHRLQIAAAGLGLVACPFTLASVTVLLYMTRPEVKRVFRPGRRGGPGTGPSEPTFALSILGMLGLGLTVSAMALLVAGRAR